MKKNYKKNWEKLLIAQRKNSKPNNNNANTYRTDFIIDIDRITFSSAFRRLAKKTQVHPLSNNDQIHNRLTHTLETESVGRSLGIYIGHWLQNKNELPEETSPANIAEVVQAACLAHDIGNPPFGHAGEYAIRDWFTNNEKAYLEGLTEAQKKDFKFFDGNAQGFRVINTTEYNYNDGGMRLTYPTLATMIKYPYDSETASSLFEKNKMKFNYYQAEKDDFAEIFETLGLLKNNKFIRHPLSFLSEAADDICYSIIDLEDAYELNIIKIEEIFNCIEEANQNFEQDIEIKNLKIEEIKNSNDQNRQKLGILRSRLIKMFINDVNKAFINNYEKIINGEISDNLINYSAPRSKNLIEALKSFALENIYNEKTKNNLEIGSYSVFERLLNTFIPAVYEQIKTDKNLSFKSKKVLEILSNKAPQKGDDLYLAYLKVIDYISGMTDDYATFISLKFLGAGQ